ncbi:MAG: hypothetical protein IKA40_05470, partial [Clostridia bacterium]|nr:hypothetical protein [Clostridia bacterium]
MRKKNITKLTLMLASALVSTAFGGAFLVANQAAADTATPTAATQSLDSVFEKSGANTELLPQTIGEGATATKVAAYKLSNGGSVKFKRNLALKWYEGKDDAAYATVKFSFKDTEFTKMTLSMDTASAWATVEGKTTNVIEFVKGEGDVLSAYVNPTWNEDGTLANGAKAQAIANKTGVLTLQLQQTAKDGQFKVAITEEGGTADFDKLDAFTNIGANYAKYVAKNDYPLTFKATTAADKTTIVCIHEINGQKFTNVTNDDKVADTAAPVLVLNETFDGFLLGTKFTLNENDDDYRVIDVLQDSNLDKKVKAYQYNPAKQIETGKEKEVYFDLTTSRVFYETSYTTAENKLTSVYKATGGEEYVSIYFELGDDTYNQSTGDYQKATYFLSWYASKSVAEVSASATLATSVKTAPAGGEWILLNNEASAPYYKIPAESATDEEKAAYEKAKTEFTAA